VLTLPDSKLPRVGTTIFTVMSRLAAECGAINLSQGFPDFDPPLRLVDLVVEAMRSGVNQYAPMEGSPALREAIAAKVLALYGCQVDPAAGVTVTAIRAVMAAMVVTAATATTAVCASPVSSRSTALPRSSRAVAGSRSPHSW